MTYMCLDARKPVFEVCEQQRCRPACASAQIDQRLCHFLFGKLESIMFKLATREISIFWLVSVAEQACLSLALSESLKTGLSRRGPYGISGK